MRNFLGVKPSNIKTATIIFQTYQVIYSLESLGVTLVDVQALNSMAGPVQQLYFTKVH